MQANRITGRPMSPHRLLKFVGLSGTAALLGCSALPPAPPAAPVVPLGVVAAARAASSPVAVAPLPPGSPPPFDVVIRGASRQEGALTVWRKDDKVWIELMPQDFGRPLLLSPKLSTGIGQSFIIGGLMSYPFHGVGGPQLVEFVRVHNIVRLQARNTDVAATPGTPEARALAASFSPSLLGSVPVASQPEAERKSVLIEANGLFLGDLLGTAMRLQQTFRQGYVLDARNSAIVDARSSPRSLEIVTQNHYYAANIALPQPGAPPGAPQPSLPKYLPDARSLFIGHHYSLAPLPQQAMAAREADPRIGLMTNTVLDFSNDQARTPRRRSVQRWRLEKKDPGAALSEPVQPIVFWIDRNVPLKYRATLREGILEWNKAFEAIGFKGAIEVRQQADDAAFDTLDLGYASVRWMMSAEPVFGAIGPRHIDPRSGEILDADIGIESLSARNMRVVRRETLGALGGSSGAAAFEAMLGQAGVPTQNQCQHADLAAEQLAYALDVLQARGELNADDKHTEQFVLDYLKDTTIHETGHALGLRHNFRASRAYTAAQLDDPVFTAQHGTTASVMEYNAINLPRLGESGGTPFQTVLGPYDYWAIEYAYRPLAPADEAAALLRIAARSNEPLLGFGSDEDAALGIDPESLPLDLGSDPVVFAAKRLDIARELFQLQEVRPLRSDESYAVLRRSLAYAIADSGRAVGVLVRQIGGVRTLRDYPGSGRDPLLPVDAAVQRRALDLIARQVLAIDGLSISAQLQRRLAPDFDDRSEVPGVPTEFSVPARLLQLQQAVLAQLLSDTLAARILDSVGQADRPASAFQLSELYARLSRDVWSELGSGAPISGPRRDLQREYLNRVAAALLRPDPKARADARSLLRAQAQLLQRQIGTALQRPDAFDATTRAHLRDAADTLQQALSARLPRAGV